MCKHPRCWSKRYGTLHLLYWLLQWVKQGDWPKAKKTIYHLFNRKAYTSWRIDRQVNRWLHHCEELRDAGIV